MHALDILITYEVPGYKFFFFLIFKKPNTSSRGKISFFSLKDKNFEKWHKLYFKESILMLPEVFKAEVIVELETRMYVKLLPFLHSLVEAGSNMSCKL